MKSGIALSNPGRDIAALRLGARQTQLAIFAAEVGHDRQAIMAQVGLDDTGWDALQIDDRGETLRWERCGASCVAVPDAVGGRCFTHLPKPERQTAISRQVAEGKLDCRGHVLNFELLENIQEALDASGAGSSSTSLVFDGCLVVDNVSWAGWEFKKEVSFRSTSWIGEADFSKCTFVDKADFTFAVFDLQPKFRQVTFGSLANFSKTRFGVGSEQSVFMPDSITQFADTSFSGPTYFTGVYFAGTADFPRCRFLGEANFGAVVVAGLFLSLSHAVIEAAFVLRASSSFVWLDGIEVNYPASLEIRFAEISIQNARISQPMTISYWTASEWTHAAEGDLLIAIMANELNLSGLPKPRILALSDTDVSHLILRDVDLRACLFTGARSLEKLTLNGSPTFPNLGARTAIADDLIWRRNLLEEVSYDQAKRDKWRIFLALGRQLRKSWFNLTEDCYDSNTRRSLLAAADAPGISLTEREQICAYEYRLGQALPTPHAADVEKSYRELRRRFEDSGDKPGADDFYYGEMEVRRLHPDKTKSWPRLTQKLLLSVYFVISGYGLRSWRPLAGFVALVLAGGIALPCVASYAEGATSRDKIEAEGGDVKAGDAFLYSVQLAVLPLQRMEPPLSFGPWGHVVRLFLVILGPLLIALFLLALRSRLKR